MTVRIWLWVDLHQSRNSPFLHKVSTSGSLAKGEDYPSIFGFKVHLGSGNVPCYDPNVISIDILPTDNIDIVAEAEHLPFLNNSVVYLESGAVFEHLYDPLKAISEVKRILIPGAIFNIDTAFIQSYHGFPSHYFNMTPQAVETFIVDDFELIESVIPIDASPAIALENLLQRFISALPYTDRVNLLSLPLLNFIQELTSGKHDFYKKMDQHILRSLAASISVTAKKPYNYQSHTSDEMIEIRKDYYTYRVAVIQRHFECCYYRDRAIEGNALVLSHDLISLSEIIKIAKVIDHSDLFSWKTAIAFLQKTEQNLCVYRDQMIQIYLPIMEELKIREKKEILERLNRTTS